MFTFFYFIAFFLPRFGFFIIPAMSQSFHTPNLFYLEYLVRDGACIFSFFSSDVSNTQEQGWREKRKVGLQLRRIEGTNYLITVRTHVQSSDKFPYGSWRQRCMTFF